MRAGVLDDAPCMPCQLGGAVQTVTDERPSQMKEIEEFTKMLEMEKEDKA